MQITKHLNGPLSPTKIVLGYLIGKLDSIFYDSLFQYPCRWPVYFRKLDAHEGGSCIGLELQNNENGKWLAWGSITMRREN